MAPIPKKVPIFAVKTHKRTEVFAVKSVGEPKAQPKVPAVPVDVHVSKITNSRLDLGDGTYMMTYYFKKGPFGEYIAEDYRTATHYERAVYDEYNNILGSTIGEITPAIRY